MKFTRRDFLKLGCLSVVGAASLGTIGCSSPQSANSSDVSGSQDEEGSDMTDSSSTAASAAGGSSANGTSSGDAAVVFFSCTGNTEAVAEKIAAATDGTLMRIDPAEPYGPADLDYNSDCRANAEQNSGSARPAIAAPIPDIAAYDTIYLGYPIWWGKAPRVILTFLEEANTAGKIIVPFCTSGSSPISGSIAEIEQAAPSANVLDGRRFSASASQQEIDSWVASIS